MTATVDDIAEHPAASPPRGVCVFNINNGSVTTQFHLALLALLMWELQHDSNVLHYHGKVASSVLSIARSSATTMFLQETNCEWMLQFDSDIEMAPDTVSRLLEVAHPTKRPIVSGLYCSALPEGLSAVAWDTRGRVLEGKRVRKLLDGGQRLVKVSRVGAGCLLVHRDVLTAMYNANPDDPWFGEHIINGVKAGEDFTFCDRARALNYPIYLDLSTELGHVKTIILNKTMLGNVEISQEATQ